MAAKYSSSYLKMPSVRVHEMAGNALAGLRASRKHKGERIVQDEIRKYEKSWLYRRLFGPVTAEAVKERLQSGGEWDWWVSDYLQRDESRLVGIYNSTAPHVYAGDVDVSVDDMALMLRFFTSSRA